LGTPPGVRHGAVESQPRYSKQAERVWFVLDHETFAHIGLYTAKPLPQRIESDQGHGRDNASAMRMNSQRLTWVGDELVYGRRTLLRIERDAVYPACASLTAASPTWSTVLAPRTLRYR